MNKQNNNKSKENSYERICKLYGRCCNQHENLDSLRISLYGLHCMNKYGSGAS